MMDGYKTCFSESRFEQEILKSKFIGYVFPVRDVSEACEKLSVIRKKHSDATHNCYAYVIGQNMTLKKFSDDKEPQGTAGLPILDVIERQELTDTLIVVTRYFGGTKLGVGGLVRAYSGTALKALEISEKCEYRRCDFYTMSVSYDTYNKIQNGLSVVYTTKTSFLSNVQIDFVTDDENIVKKITDMCGGKCSVQFAKRDYYKFKLNKGE